MSRCSRSPILMRQAALSSGDKNAENSPGLESTYGAKRVGQLALPPLHTGGRRPCLNRRQPCHGAPCQRAGNDWLSSHRIADLTRALSRARQRRPPSCAGFRQLPVQYRLLLGQHRRSHYALLAGRLAWKCNRIRFWEPRELIAGTAADRPISHIEDCGCAVYDSLGSLLPLYACLAGEQIGHRVVALTCGECCTPRRVGHRASATPILPSYCCE